MKLALGTVQFGMDYGISNKLGQVSQNKIKKILTYAKNNGIDTLDSAAAYGNSEQHLGQLAASEHFHIITKIPALDSSASSILPVISNSLNTLKTNKLKAILFHDVSTLLNHPFANTFCQELIELKKQNTVENVGVSLYSPQQLLPAMNKLPLDIIQVPVNILDQRFIQSDISNICQQHNIKLHARSLFLQGLLLMPINTWPEYFAPYKAILTKVIALAKQQQCSPLSLALTFMVQNSLKFPHIEKFVVGCCSQAQLNEIVTSYQQALNIEKSIDWSEFASDEQALINPSLWKTT